MSIFLLLVRDCSPVLAHLVLLLHDGGLGLGLLEGDGVGAPSAAAVEQFRGFLLLGDAYLGRGHPHRAVLDLAQDVGGLESLNFRRRPPQFGYWGPLLKVCFWKFESAGRAFWVDYSKSRRVRPQPSGARAGHAMRAERERGRAKTEGKVLHDVSRPKLFLLLSTVVLVVAKYTWPAGKRTLSLNFSHPALAVPVVALA